MQAGPIQQSRWDGNLEINLRFKLHTFMIPPITLKCVMTSHRNATGFVHASGHKVSKPSAGCSTIVTRLLRVASCPSFNHIDSLETPTPAVLHTFVSASLLVRTLLVSYSSNQHGPIPSSSAPLPFLALHPEPF
jgi:hypothetical protein